MLQVLRVLFWCSIFSIASAWISKGNCTMHRPNYPARILDVDLFSCVPWGTRGVDGFRQCCLPGAETPQCAAIPYDPPDDEGHHKRSGSIVIDTAGTTKAASNPQKNVILKANKVKSTVSTDPKSWAPEVKQYGVEGKPEQAVCFVVPDYACYWSYANDEFGYDIRYERQAPTDKCVEAWSPQEKTWYQRCCVPDEHKYLSCLMFDSDKHPNPGAHQMPQFEQTPWDPTFVRDGDSKHKDDYYTGGIYCDEIIDVSKRPPPGHSAGGTEPGISMSNGE